MEKETGCPLEKLVRWKVYDFHYRLLYLAKQAQALRKYNDIMQTKAKSKRK